MATSYAYEITVTNEYLGKARTIKGHSKQECEINARGQIERWDEEARRLKERRAREQQRKAKEAAKNAQAQKDAEDQEYAADLNAESEEQFRYIDEILNNLSSIEKGKFLESLRQTEKYADFVFKESKPSKKHHVTKEQVIEQLGGVPKQSGLDSFLSVFIKSKKEAFKNLTETFSANVEKVLKDANDLIEKENKDKFDKWNSRFENAKAEYAKEKELYYIEQKKANEYIDSLLTAEKGSESYRAFIGLLGNGIEERLLGSSEVNVAFDKDRNTIIVDYRIINLDELPEERGWKYVKSRKAIEPVEYKRGQKKSIFQKYVFDSSLGIVAAVIGCVRSDDIEAIGLNCWVDYVDSSTGKEATSCILTLFSSVKDLLDINFNSVDSKDCIKRLKGLFAPDVSSLTPVKPIVVFDKEDSRFIESKDVIEIMDPHSNLAIMDWEDFEYLVRQLFGRIFSGDDCEVKVTQASRDQGVDAVAFDPDPIRGGKYVIQAKRYNNVVGVSAVRDLYGTMINEGANKGILVTTSYFGSESINFCKDKPLQLIDGNNLLHLLSEYGYGEFNITLGAE